MKVRCLAVSAVLGILLFACGGSPEERKHRFLELGNKYYETGKYKEASILYRRALQADRKFADAHYALGLTELKLQNLQNAGGAFLRAFQLDPANLKAFRQLAELHLLVLQRSVPVQREETRASLFDITEKAASINGDVFEVLYIQGRIRLLDGDAEAALPLLRKAVELAPAEIVARLFLATALVHNNQFAEADANAAGDDREPPGCARRSTLCGTPCCCAETRLTKRRRFSNGAGRLIPTRTLLGLPWRNTTWR